MRTKITTFDNIEKRIFKALIAGILFSAFLYIYFVSTSVVNIVQRKNIESETQGLSSNVGNLESQYISLNKNITLSYAKSLGYVEPRDISFVSNDSFAMNI